MNLYLFIKITSVNAFKNYFSCKPVTIILVASLVIAIVYAIIGVIEVY